MMDDQLSAFQVYQKQNKNKRRAPLGAKERSKATSPLIKRKRDDTTPKLNSKERIREENGSVKKKKLKIISEGSDVRLGNGHVISELEIPSLISNVNLEMESESKTKSVALAKKLFSNKTVIKDKLKKPKSFKPATSSVQVGTEENINLKKKATTKLGHMSSEEEGPVHALNHDFKDVDEQETKHSKKEKLSKTSVNDRFTTENKFKKKVNSKPRSDHSLDTNGLQELTKAISSLKKKKNKESKTSINLEKANANFEEEIPTLIPITGFERPYEAEYKAKDGKLKKMKSNKTECAEDISEAQVFNPLMQGLALFKWLIDPIAPREFFEKYWEKDVLYVKRSDREYFSDVFSSEKLDGILRDYPLHFTRNIDVVAYQNGTKEVIDEEGRAFPTKLWDFYNNGCSVRLLNPQTYDQNIHSVISSMQEYFGTMVGTNAYLTPPDSQGFAPHFDDIEAFIVQLEGSKYWKLYKPKEQDILARDSSQNFKAEDLGTPFMEVKLEAGDLLYFPRGTIHEGRTNDEHSLHITVSVYQHTAYIDLLEQALPAALKKAASDNLEFRKGLPLNYLKHLGFVNKNDKSEKRKFLVTKIKSLVDSLVNYIDIDSAADSLGRKFMYDAMPPLYSKEEAQYSSKFDGDFMKNGKVYNRVEINAEIKVRLLRYYALRVVKESETTSKLYFCTDNAKTYHGEEEQWLEISNSLIPAVEMLQNRYPEFIVADSLPIDSEYEKLDLISSLWEHGLLVTDGPLPNCDSGDETGASSSNESGSEDD